MSGLNALTRRAKLAGLLAALVVVLVGSRLTPVPSTGAPAGAPDFAVDAAFAGGTRPAGERVAFWEARVAAGGSYLDRIFLADAYLDRVRISGDLADLERAGLALDEAAADAPDPGPVLVRQAQVAFVRHEFTTAAEIAEELLAADANDLAALSIAGDAWLELGQLDRARTHYQRLALRAPSAAAWVRLGRLAFLTGELDRARRLAVQAVVDAEADGWAEGLAFYRSYAAELARADGDLDAAAEHYLAALDAVPQYAPALAGLGRVREAQGDRSAAIELLERSTALLPQPEVVAALGDLYALAGDEARAGRQYALVERIGRLAAANGSVYDRQLVLNAADHGLDTAVAVERAEADLAVRSDVYSHDALAWALFADGRVDEASTEAALAIALGTPDARLRYHAGLIAAAEGRTADALDLLVAARRGASLLPPLQVARLEQTIASLSGEARP